LSIRWTDNPSAGGIIQASSYKVAFYAMGGAFGLALIMIFFWMPETAYVRTGVVNLDTGSNNVRYKDHWSMETSFANNLRS